MDEDLEAVTREQLGKAWKGIYALEGDTLTVCDNARDLTKGRPTTLEAKAGAGYVLIAFTRASP